MSRPYILRVSESIRRHFRVGDGVDTCIDLLGVLPPDELARLLSTELAARGFAPPAEGSTAWTRTEPNGVTITVEPETRAVRIAKEREHDAEENISVEVRSYSPAGAEAERKHIIKRAESRLEADAERQRAEISSELEQTLRDHSLELDAIAVKVTQEALKIRASRLGDVVSVHEDTSTGSMTIRVRV
ncbi:MAG: hypothetical protein U0271_20405 [Polyangiaceae bacterium]